MNSSYLFALALILFPLPTLAQLTPDATLGSTVTPNILINGVNSQRINGGTVRGGNLFHSFSEFNVNAGNSIYFSNPPDITNIFTRVTGANPSNINGRLGILGNANLFLMNPNGIVFGVGAKLDVKGSFLGTTATSINFADGTEFSRGGVTPPLPTPLLCVTVPIGLGFGNNPAAITVQGIGSQFKQQPLGTVLERNSNSTGLQVKKR